MPVLNPHHATIILDDGTSFDAVSNGAKKISFGELVFNTSMTGYMETLTDPSFFGQIVIQTFPVIGNYGVCENDLESTKPWVSGFVVHKLCKNPSNFRNKSNLSNWLNRYEVAAVSEVNTRNLTKKIRNGETKNCAIVADPTFTDFKNLINLIKTYKVKHDAVDITSTKTIQTFTKSNFDYSNSSILLNKIKIEKTNFKICVLDFGTKLSILKNLAIRCKEVLLLPCKTTPEQIKNLKPDGIVLTNGPGDPACNLEIIDNLKQIQSFKIPIFGICLGHQLLALANGAKTKKLKFGHRGSNQPVIELKTKKTFMTAQNHGYIVDLNSLNDEIAKSSFLNVNDGSCEGIEYSKFPGFSVQFHPEACAGPNDTNFLFDRFFKLIKQTKIQNKTV